MTFNEQIEALVAAAENAVDQCLIPVPALLLVRLGNACVALESDESDERDVAEDHPIWALASVCEDVEWTFWPETEYGSRQALADPYLLQQVAEALETYREAMAEAAHGGVRD